MLHIIRHLKKIIISFLYKKKHIKKNLVFHFGSIINEKCEFEGYNSVGENTQLISCSLGRGTYVGRNNKLNNFKIGRFCSIGSFIINTTGNHPTKKFVSTHPAFFSKEKAAGYTFMKESKYKEIHYSEDNYLITIGNDVWIGDNVTFLDGLKIGDGAIIGAGSLVTKDIEPYTICVGVPAKTIRKRFTDEQIQFLLDFQWWNKDWKWINEKSDIFENIDQFIKEIK